MTLSEQLNQLARHAAVKIKDAKTLADIDQLEIHFLGRKGDLTTLLKGLAHVSASERPKLGALGNEVKMNIEGMITAAKESLGAGEVNQKLMDESEDVTEPGAKPRAGHIHLVNQAIEEIADIFERAGFSRTRHPEVDWDWYAFEALNMPADHPARDEWETFFMDAPTHPKWGRMLLTPHSTNGTARSLASHKPPIRCINIAKTYRRQIDVTHIPMFHQFDGVYVDENVSVTHLIGILDYFAKEFFGPDRKTRLRPFHFRFTEPSFEFDISCGVCGGTGYLTGARIPEPGAPKIDVPRSAFRVTGEKCRTCKQGWLELGGAGMLHPNVLKAAKIDPKKYSGLAFGWGVERTYMMKEGLQLDDIRTLYKNDLRFLQQF